MHTISRRWAAKRLSALPLALVVPSISPLPSGATAHESSDLVIGEFVGAIRIEDQQHHDLLVTVVAEPSPIKDANRSAHAYICNGEGLSEWFAGDIEGNDFAFTSKNGAEIEGKLSDDGVAGSVKLADGATHDFVVNRSSGNNGLYHVIHSSDSSAGASYRGVLFQFGVNDEGLLEGLFLHPDDTTEPISVPLPPSQITTEAETHSSTPTGEGLPLSTSWIIVYGKLPSLLIAGSFIPTKQTCRFMTVTVTTASGATSQQFVKICN
jgi:hypothetical protein